GFSLLHICVPVPGVSRVKIKLCRVLCEGLEVPVKLITFQFVDCRMSLAVLNDLARCHSEDAVVEIVRMGESENGGNMFPWRIHQILDEELGFFRVPCLVPHRSLWFIQSDRGPFGDDLPSLHILQCFKAEIVNVELPAVNILLPLLLEAYHRVGLAHLVAVACDQDPWNESFVFCGSDYLHEPIWERSRFCHDRVVLPSRTSVS